MGCRWKGHAGALAVRPAHDATIVTDTITLYPVMASIVAAYLVDESIGLPLPVGIAAVFTGIPIASTGGRA